MLCCNSTVENAFNAEKFQIFSLGYESGHIAF